MEDRVKVHLSYDDSLAIQLAIECPSCHAQQTFPVEDLHTGFGFICKCGEEFPLNVAALAPVTHELEEIKHLVKKTIVLPV